jgi:hypothetical protein
LLEAFSTGVSFARELYLGCRIKVKEINEIIALRHIHIVSNLEEMTLLNYMCIETHTNTESLNNQIRRSRNQNYQTPYTSFET